MQSLGAIVKHFKHFQHSYFNTVLYAPQEQLFSEVCTERCSSVDNLLNLFFVRNHKVLEMKQSHSDWSVDFQLRYTGVYCRNLLGNTAIFTHGPPFFFKGSKVIGQLTDWIEVVSWPLVPYPLIIQWQIRQIKDVELISANCSVEVRILGPTEYFL